MENLTLKQLRYFEAVAREGHFGRAADRCAISQPALSVQIRELETTLGSKLFERGARNVRLTAFGEVFASRVRPILQSVEELGDLARAAQGALAGRLRLGVIPTVAPYLLPAFVSGMSRNFPEVELELRETVTSRLLDALAHGSLDAALLALPVSVPSLVEMPLFSEAFVLVRPLSDQGRPVPDAEGLRAMKLLLLEEGHCFRDQALDFCAMGKGGPRAGLDGSSLSTLVQMVGAGLGVTLIPEMAVEIETRSAPVSVSRFEAPGPARTLGLVWRKTNPMGKQLARVGRVVTDAMSQNGHMPGPDPARLARGAAPP